MDLIDPNLLLRAYASGVFPMSASREADDIYWAEPRRRAILPLDQFRLSKSLRKTLRSGRFRVTLDLAFGEVVRHCADREETWISGLIERSYTVLHLADHAHSIETWQDGELVGGLYGVKLGRAFFGESMFSSQRDASKVALAWLVARLKVGGFSLLDCQFITPHLESLGAIEIDRKSYLAILASAVGAGPSDAASSGAESAGAAAGDLRALDRLLGEAPTGSPPSGWVIAQLLGQTS